ncbi:TonB-dependent receptor [Pedobacter xixiisoli]|uniref:TonB-dependent Receptor Plug Domain n=1 Tax=Pedobacter xixiisoli TaxID=1476464 RepID=A0A286A005_9SPHI|nr:TonB-dependent receptor [Pedobacter xixiisoli]SOD15233.1 TonB-dependent Receptor Plug Domain [Pedobacter xixiisoli]
MNKTITKVILMICVLLWTGFAAIAQSIVVSGTVKDKLTNEPIPGVSVTVKGKTIGSSTDQNGRFSFTTTEKPPFTLSVTFVGYTTIERSVTGATNNLSFELESGAILGQEVVVSASRTPERILESPVTIERLGQAQIKEAAAPSFYDAIQNIKGVEMSTQSLTFRSYNTRGFNANGNTRFNQLIDGMDNQAPGLNFSVGNIVGITELDVDNVELLPGASSALYGAGGISGTMLMTSKDPFKYQGVSFQLKTGVNHVNDNNTSAQEFRQFDMRMAKSWNNKFGAKFAFSFLQAKDWFGTNTSNFDRNANMPKAGDRQSDPAYDGVNVYGDETAYNMRTTNNTVEAGARQAILNASGGLFNPQTVLNNLPAGTPYANYISFINTNVPAALRTAVTSQYLPFYYAQRNPGVLPNQNITRTGYNEIDLVDYDTKSLKMSGGLYYNFTPTIQLTAQANWGTGTSVYTGSDRYSLRNFNIGLYKLELKGEDFYVRGYTTQERSGDSYISSILGAYVSEKDKSSTAWLPQYIGTYVGARLNPAVTEAQAHVAARQAADAGRAMPGSARFETFAEEIKNTYISQTNLATGVYGAKFNDKSNLYHYEGMYNFSRLFDNVVEFQIGASARRFDLNSGGTIFDDLSREIDIDEYAAFGQLGKKFGESFKLTVAGRYDKSQNFDGRFTPRVTGVWTVAKNSNIRASFQTGFRNPTTQNQYINLAVGGGSQRLIGGIPEFLDKYNLQGNRPYTEASYRAFVNALAAGQPTTGILKEYTFDSRGVRPESVNAFELGYKGLLGSNFLIDVYGFYNEYKNFITGVNVHQLNGTTFTKFGVPVNATGKVTTYGGAFGLDYVRGKYTFSGNVSYNKLNDLPADYNNDFNTPEIRYNLGISNREVFKNVGFNVNYRWQDRFVWFSSFAGGEVPAFGTVDAQVNLKVPSVNSIVKIGGSNILNKYYITSYGNPEVGAMYYVSLAFNP